MYTSQSSRMGVIALGALMTGAFLTAAIPAAAEQAPSDGVVSVVESSIDSGQLAEAVETESLVADIAAPVIEVPTSGEDVPTSVETPVVDPSSNVEGEAQPESTTVASPVPVEAGPIRGPVYNPASRFLSLEGREILVRECFWRMERPPYAIPECVIDSPGPDETFSFDLKQIEATPPFTALGVDMSQWQWPATADSGTIYTIYATDQPGAGSTSANLHMNPIYPAQPGEEETPPVVEPPVIVPPVVEPPVVELPVIVPPVIVPPAEEVPVGEAPAPVVESAPDQNAARLPETGPGEVFALLTVGLGGIVIGLALMVYRLRRRSHTTR